MALNPDLPVTFALQLLKAVTVIAPLPAIPLVPGRERPVPAADPVPETA